MTPILCTNCRRPYPDEGVPHRCPACMGVFDYAAYPVFDPSGAEPNLPGIWRYRHTFRLPETTPPVSLGEGATPLVCTEAFSRRIAFKLEFLNPTGSYKDRGSAVLAGFLRSRGVTQAVEDSSGNAGASFAAYASASGIAARVFVPDAASGPKRQQIEAYGAEIVRILGPRSNAAEAVLRAAAAGAVYASHAFLPHCLAGYTTLAYELYEQLGGAPGAVVLPAGQGNLLLAVLRGFISLQEAGLIGTAPRMFGVQARACAPLWAMYNYGPPGMGWVSEGETLAEGVRVHHPVRGDQVLQALGQSGGGVLAVDEAAILPGRDQLARLGFYVEPTSAIVWDALEQLLSSGSNLPDPIVVVLTGSGLKTP